MNQHRPALIVIDIQNDYFPGGNFPLWEPDATLARIEQLILQANRQDMPVILVQHIAAGTAPFFNADTQGAAIHPRILAAAPAAPIVIKTHADSFLDTTLADVLKPLGVNELLLCGMMTHNCVTHTALSPQAGGYSIKVIGDACTSVSQMIHLIALKALGDRVEIVGGI